MKTSRSKGVDFSVNMDLPDGILADYYTNHLFIHVLCQSLAEKEASASPLCQGVAGCTRTTSPRPMHSRDENRPSSTLRKVNSNDIEKAIPKEEPPPNPKKTRARTADRRAAAEHRIKAADEANELLRDSTYSVRVLSQVRITQCVM
jgi:hypothetical protein